MLTEIQVFLTIVWIASAQTNGDPYCYGMVRCPAEQVCYKTIYTNQTVGSTLRSFGQNATRCAPSGEPLTRSKPDHCLWEFFETHCRTVRLGYDSRFCDTYLTCLVMDTPNPNNQKPCGSTQCNIDDICFQQTLCSRGSDTLECQIMEERCIRESQLPSLQQSASCPHDNVLTEFKRTCKYRDFNSIDGCNEKRICWYPFEFSGPGVMNNITQP